jgi:hypothetical protein
VPAANSINHDTPFVEKDYCGRSIVFAAIKRPILSRKKQRRGLCTRYLLIVLPMGYRTDLGKRIKQNGTRQ